MPILTVVFCCVALGSQSTNTSEPTDSDEGNKYEAQQQLRLHGVFLAGSNAGWLHDGASALPQGLKQGLRAPGASVARNFTCAEGPSNPSFSVDQHGSGVGSRKLTVQRWPSLWLHAILHSFPWPVPRSTSSRAVGEARVSMVGGYRRLEQLHRIDSSSGPEHAG